MIYVKQDFVDNETTLKAEHLNAMEDGIIAAEASKIRATVEIGSFASSGGYSIGHYGKTHYRTPKYIRPITNTITVNISMDCQFKISMYDKKFDYISSGEYYTCTKETDLTITIPDNSCEYVRLTIRKNVSTPLFDLPVVYISNVAPIEYFEKRPASGYQVINVPINVVKLNTTESSDWVLQDAPEYYEDDGFLKLPTTYSNTGKPTRLIIWCHGASGHYSPTTTDFPASVLGSDYWLQEGYAIMDMEGYPFNDKTKTHQWHPATGQCYEAGYNWVVKNFNIYTDGVLLGGRSMGGGTCLQLVQDTSIPFLALTSVVGMSNYLQYWSKPTCPRQQHAEQMNFSKPYPTWSTTKRCSQEEWDYLRSNWKQLRQYHAQIKGIRGLNSEQDIDDFFEASYLDWDDRSEVTTETEFYDKLSYEMPIPVKLFTFYEDPTIIYERHQRLLQKMIQNGGQICELRVMHTDAQGANAHAADQVDSRRNVQVTTIFGETVTAPLVYVEMLRFWRRYEKDLR